MSDDWQVCKPGDPYDGRVGHLIKIEEQVNKLPRGTLRFSDGAERTYEGREIRALVRW
jgi:hypothetical protein